ncbi:MAG: hypothetical protein OJF55_001888 [Rhodanobacteraceae bacterium]|jgi:multidrug transporter EmrE-like cation transporter|nr:MAG: hypothetical protein OJF55_001888 [Rhodanobacteraceae bacterium]
MMSWLLVLLTILFTVYGQIAIKWQVVLAGSLPHDQAAKALFVIRLLLNPWIISALIAAFLAAVCWIGAMTKLPLSRAYPFMALNFILVTIFASVLLGESITWPKIAGLALIVGGLVVGSLA